MLKKGDIAIIIEGSHGFKVIKKCELIEIKQGPFTPSLDKIKFEKPMNQKLRLKNNFIPVNTPKILKKIKKMF